MAKILLQTEKDYLLMGLEVNTSLSNYSQKSKIYIEQNYIFVSSLNPVMLVNILIF